MAQPTKNKPTTTHKSSLERPSLLQGLDVANILLEKQPSGIQTPWYVKDESLRPVPAFYPKLDAKCTAMIMDATPSVVASRIADCLRKRNVAVEYDNETITATCMTADRVHFNIHLYRGGPAIYDTKTETETPDMGHAVLVECLRTRGDAMSFHWTCRAVLDAAMGHSNGQYLRKPIRTGPWEFPRLERISPKEGLLPRRKKQAVAASDSILSTEKKALLALDHAATLLKKDRMCAQRLGMESLVCLTDSRSSGVRTAVVCAMAILGCSSTNSLIREENERSGTPNQIHETVFNLLQHGKLPNEHEDEAAAGIDASARSCVRGSLGVDTGVSGSDGSPAAGVQEDEHHGGILRALALRSLANSLLVLSRNEPKKLNTTVESRLTSHDFLLALVQDIAGGATRSPIAVIGTKLASPHEAALAATCLRVLVECSDQAKTQLQREKPIWEALDKACGTGRHDLLGQEAERALQSLSGGHLMAS